MPNLEKEELITGPTQNVIWAWKRSRDNSPTTGAVSYKQELHIITDMDI